MKCDAITHSAKETMQQNLKKKGVGNIEGVFIK